MREPFSSVRLQLSGHSDSYDIGRQSPARWRGATIVAAMIAPLFLAGWILLGFSGNGFAEVAGPVQKSSSQSPDREARPKTNSASRPGPIVPGFIRLNAEGSAQKDSKSNNALSKDHTLAGRLLLGELNCLACHQAGAEWKENAFPRPAPVLDRLGERVSIDYLRRFLANPHQEKPGTLMPAPFAADSESERTNKVESLVHFLSTTGVQRHAAPDAGAVVRGEKLFHEIGCAVCHDSPRKDAIRLADSVPLGKLIEKYSLPALAQFLKDPHAVRPAGRMPSLHLSDKEALEIASYLLRDIRVQANLRYVYYEGNWSKLPDFTQLKPLATGTISSIDLTMARRPMNYAMRFEGFLQIAHDGEYTFHAGSDDGSRVVVGNHTVVENDGDHPFATKSGKLRLTRGAHPLRVEYYQNGGGAGLEVEIEGPNTSRQPVAPLLTLTSDPPGPVDPPFRADPARVEQGRQLFSTSGCASCHDLRNNGNGSVKAGQFLTSQLKAKPLSSIIEAMERRIVDGKSKEQTSDVGCLAESARPGVPFFSLDRRQREALKMALTTKPDKSQTLGEETITRTMAVFNCYACHERAKRGGPTSERDPFFRSSIPEMGDEGRLPPTLDGVGDKLQPSWLVELLQNGARDRPYMLVRMPRYQLAHAQLLTNAFAKADDKPVSKLPRFDELNGKLKFQGRHLVGAKAFSCIKCHTFGSQPSTGIQAIGLTSMSRRLREDWFYRYMLKPLSYRPGTRMPTPFPGGVSTAFDVYNGDTNKQLLALWTYLSDGPAAREPIGLARKSIELIPENRPIIYRNFIEGLSPRAIAVGFPEKVHLAFDAELLAPRLIWQRAFIDAGKHWHDRSVGYQGPLGDNIISLSALVSVAELPNDEAAWPTKPAREQGWKFLGYRLDDKGQPIFRYGNSTWIVEDQFRPKKIGNDLGFERVVTATPVAKAVGASSPQLKSPKLYLLVAAGKSIQSEKEGWLRVDERLRIRARGAKITAVDFPSMKGQLSTMPIVLKNGKATVVLEYSW